jgi:competence protein ComEA
MSWFVMFVMLSVAGCEHRWVKQGEWSRDEIDAWRVEADLRESSEPHDVEMRAVVEAPPPDTDARGAPPQEPSQVCLNTATEAELIKLPGVGPAMANRIIEHRIKKPFRRVHDLRKIKGIGAKTYKKLAPLVRVE